MAVVINVYPHEMLTVIVTFYSRIPQGVTVTNKLGQEEFAITAQDNRPGVFSITNKDDSEVMYLNLEATFQQEGKNDWQSCRHKYFYNNWMGCKIGFDDRRPSSDFDDISVFMKMDSLNYPVRLVHPGQPHLFVNEMTETAGS